MNHLPKPRPTRPHEAVDKDEAVKLIRELAVTPPVKGMANMKAATDVFEANLPEGEGEPPKRSKSDRAAETNRRPPS